MTLLDTKLIRQYRKSMKWKTIASKIGIPVDSLRAWRKETNYIDDLDVAEDDDNEGYTLETFLQSYQNDPDKDAESSFLPYENFSRMFGYTLVREFYKSNPELYRQGEWVHPNEADVMDIIGKFYVTLNPDGYLLKRKSRDNDADSAEIAEPPSGRPRMMLRGTSKKYPIGRESDSDNDNDNSYKVVVDDGDDEDAKGDDDMVGKGNSTAE